MKKLIVSKSMFEPNFQDYPDFESMCVSLYFQGCTLHCNGCHNYSLWYKKDGSEIAVDELVDRTVTELAMNRTNNLVLVGGEPLQQDFDALLDFVSKLQIRGVNICLYTGYTFDEKQDEIRRLNVEYVVAGKFDIDNLQVAGKDETLKTFSVGSKNQKVYFYNHLISKDGVARIDG